MRLLLIAFVCLAIPAYCIDIPYPGLEVLLELTPTEEHPRLSEGDLIAHANGSLSLVYTRFRQGTSDFAAAEIVVRESIDGGAQWGPDRLLVPNEGETNVMSVSLHRLPSGEILLFYLVKNGWGDLNAVVRRSTDELKTLSEPVRATTTDGYNVVNNDRVIQLSTGRLIVPTALHLCPDGTRATWTRHGIPRVYYSDDDGRTWNGDKTDVSTAPDVVLQEPLVVELKDGNLWMLSRSESGSHLQSISRDGGETWSVPEPTSLYAPCSPASVERIPWTKDLLAVWNDHSGLHRWTPGKRTPLCVAVSSDEGKTWTPSRVIEGHPDGWYAYTAIEFVGDRAILAYSEMAPVGERSMELSLKVVSLSREWIYGRGEQVPGERPAP